MVLSFGLPVTVMSPAKTAKPIKMPFGIVAQVGQKSMYYVGCTLSPYVPNTTEPSMCSGDAACSQITLTTCSCCSKFCENHASSVIMHRVKNDTDVAHCYADRVCNRMAICYLTALN